VHWASHSTRLNHWPRNAKASYTPLGVKGNRERENLVLFFGYFKYFLFVLQIRYELLIFLLYVIFINLLYSFVHRQNVVAALPNFCYSTCCQFTHKHVK
jgi:hypothetical protein